MMITPYTVREVVLNIDAFVVLARLLRRELLQSLFIIKIAWYIEQTECLINMNYVYFMRISIVDEV